MSRTLRNRVFWGLCGLAFVLIAAPTIAILISIFNQAAPQLGFHLLTQPENGQVGGLRNAIVGTLVLLLGVLVLAGSVGVGAGIYLAEFSSGRLGGVLRFLSEILAGIPSIVIGYIGYVAIVVGLHWQNSLLAGMLALSVLVVPYIVKTTEVSLRQVPTALREAAAGLGVGRARTVARIILPTALPGIISGLIIALAISTGETAPLLFTTGLNGGPFAFQLTHRIEPYLTGTTYSDTIIPGAAAHAQAGAAAAMTLIILLILIFAGRLISRGARRRTERMSL